MATVAQSSAQPTQTNIPGRSSSHSDSYLNRQRLGSLLIHAILIAFAITMIFPLLWLVSTSLKHPGKQFIFPPQLIPNPVYWQNYTELFTIAPMGRYLWNSFVVSTLSTLGV